MTIKPKATDWDFYYRKDPAPSRFTRPIIERVFINAFRKYSVPRPVVVELGGAGSHVFDSVMKHINPTRYHVVDNNQYGLEVMRRRVDRPELVLHNEDVLRMNLPLQADTVFSLGLIEHFDQEGTRNAVLAHFQLLRPGGVAIISFPTPTLLYRLARWSAEKAGKWIFHDERPLWIAEVARAVAGQGEILYRKLIWPIFLTQTLIVVRKHKNQQTER